MFEKNSHCCFCGAGFPAGAAWPRQCGTCGNTSYLNPVPVAAVLLPVEGGLLVVRRATAPRVGELTFPGGYVCYGESWQQAAARELFEETRIQLPDPNVLEVFDVHSTRRGHLLTIFGLAPSIPVGDLSRFQPTEEVSELCVIAGAAELGFVEDTAVARKYFSRVSR